MLTSIEYTYSCSRIIAQTVEYRSLRVGRLQRMRWVENGFSPIKDETTTTSAMVQTTRVPTLRGWRDFLFVRRSYVFRPPVDAPSGVVTNPTHFTEKSASFALTSAHFKNDRDDYYRSVGCRHAYHRFDRTRLTNISSLSRMMHEAHGCMARHAHCTSFFCDIVHAPLHADPRLQYTANIHPSSLPD